MRHQDIYVGGSYLLKSSNHRAEVIAPAGKSPYNGRYRFLVRFPDAKPGGRLYQTEQRIEAADFKHLWTQEDQERFEKYQQQSAEINAIESGLIAAGFKPHAIRKIHEDIWINFSGEVAQRVVKALLASAELEAQVLELETTGPHDED